MLPQNNNKGFGVNPTPYSNRGSKSPTTYHSPLESTQTVSDGLEVAIDALAGTMRFSAEYERDSLITFLGNITKEEIHLEPNKGMKIGCYWHSSGRSPNSLILGWNDPSEKNNGVGLIYFQMKGQVLGKLKAKVVYDMCLTLINVFKVKFTRVDIALDDYLKQISVEQIDQAIGEKNYARFKRGNVIKNFSREIKEYGDGWTAYFGSRQSDRFTRYYDKYAESKGEVNAYRFEGEWKGELAQKAILGWISISDFDDLSPKYLAGLVISNIEFIDRSDKPEEKYIKRLPRLDWWQTFIDRVNAFVRYSREKVKPSVDRSMKWIHKQVSRSLSVLRKSMQPHSFYSWIGRELKWADENLSPWHETLIKQFTGELQSID